MVELENTTRRWRRAAGTLALACALAGCGGSLGGGPIGPGGAGRGGSSGAGGGNGSVVLGGSGSGNGSAVSGSGGGGVGAPPSGLDAGAGPDVGVPACATPVGAVLAQDADAGAGICIFVLPRPVSAAGYEWITVRVHRDTADASVQLPFDGNHVDGWDFSDSDQASIEIYGPACDDISTGAISRVVVSYVCLLI